MRADNEELSPRVDEDGPGPGLDGVGEVMEPGWEQEELLEERAGAMGRTGRRLTRLLKELKGIEAELDRLDLTLSIPGLSARLRRDIQVEMDLSVDSYNYLREAAAFAYQQLIRQRESVGFRGHELIRRCYPIPDVMLPPDDLELEELADV